MQYEPNARFIVMVRNPVEMIASMFNQQRFNGNERARLIREAIALSDLRQSGKPAEVASRYPPSDLAYLHTCALGWQLKRLYETVAADRIHVIVHDDLTADSEYCFRKLMDFLALPYVAPLDFKPVNAAKERKSFVLDDFVRELARFRGRLPLSSRFGLLSGIRRWNRRELPRKALDPLLQSRL